VTRLRDGRLDFDSGIAMDIFRHLNQNVSEAHPASFSIGIIALVSGINWPGNGTNYSPPSSTDVKNAWSCISARGKY